MLGKLIAVALLGPPPCVIGEISGLKPAYFSIYLHIKQKKHPKIGLIYF
jgi:hypothetical protein